MGTEGDEYNPTPAYALPAMTVVEGKMVCPLCGFATYRKDLDPITGESCPQCFIRFLKKYIPQLRPTLTAAPVKHKLVEEDVEKTAALDRIPGVGADPRLVTTRRVFRRKPKP